MLVWFVDKSKDGKKDLNNNNMEDLKKLQSGMSQIILTARVFDFLRNLLKHYKIKYLVDKSLTAEDIIQDVWLKFNIHSKEEGEERNIEFKQLKSYLMGLDLSQLIKFVKSFHPQRRTDEKKKHTKSVPSFVNNNNNKGLKVQKSLADDPMSLMKMMLTKELVIKETSTPYTNLLRKAIMRQTLVNFQSKYL